MYNGFLYTASSITFFNVLHVANSYTKSFYAYLQVFSDVDSGVGYLMFDYVLHCCSLRHVVKRMVRSAQNCPSEYKAGPLRTLPDITGFDFIVSLATLFHTQYVPYYASPRPVISIMIILSRTQDDLFFTKVTQFLIVLYIDQFYDVHWTLLVQFQQVSEKCTTIH